jgi:hypothetical protein
MAFAVNQSVQEAYIRGTGGAISADHFVGVHRVSKAPRSM